MSYIYISVKTGNLLPGKQGSYRRDWENQKKKSEYSN